MKTVLCFGDSNTWGYDPAATTASPFPVRHPHDMRWTGVLARALGPEWRVIEEGQNGRTTVHDDPFNIARNGKVFLPACLESHKPLDLVVMMLGTNDLKAVLSVPAGEIAAGAGVLAKMILQSDAGIKGKPPKLLLVCPPAVADLSNAPELKEKLGDGAAKSTRLPRFYEAQAAQLGCAYLNSQDIVSASPIDGVHLEAAEHAKLGEAVCRAVLKIGL